MRLSRDLGLLVFVSRRRPRLLFASPGVDPHGGQRRSGYGRHRRRCNVEHPPSTRRRGTRRMATRARDGRAWRRRRARSIQAALLPLGGRRDLPPLRPRFTTTAALICRSHGGRHRDEASTASSCDTARRPKSRLSRSRVGRKRVSFGRSRRGKPAFTTSRSRSALPRDPRFQPRCTRPPPGVDFRVTEHPKRTVVEWRRIHLPRTTAWPLTLDVPVESIALPIEASKAPDPTGFRPLTVPEDRPIAWPLLLLAVVVLLKRRSIEVRMGPDAPLVRAPWAVRVGGHRNRPCDRSMAGPQPPRLCASADRLVSAPPCEVGAARDVGDLAARPGKRAPRAIPKLRQATS